MSVHKIHHILSIIVVLISFIALDASAANIYVDNTLSSNITNGSYSIANRNSTGSAGNAYTTIQAAVSAMSPGDDIFIRGGTYYEHDIYIPASKSGTSSNWSTMQSYTGEWAIINGQRQCSGSNVHAVIYNGGFAHSGSEAFAKYWTFERLEITGGGLSGSSVAPAAGIWWNKGPATVRYCYIHDNLADNADENPAGFNGCSQQGVTIEYCYFRNNGSVQHEHGNDRNICFTGSTEYSSTPYDENWYVKNNIIRNNYINCNGGGGIMTKAIQRLTSVRDGSNMTNKAWGDQIYNNIVVNAKYAGIFWQQDFVQIHNNIVVMASGLSGSHWNIATRRWGSEGCDIQHATIYNNTLINGVGASIFHGVDGKYSVKDYWYCYNNIIDKHTDDYDAWDITYGHMTYYTGITNGMFSDSGIRIDRNYFYRCPNTSTILYRTISGTGDNYTIAQWEQKFSGTNLFQNSYSSSNLLYTGTSGADAYTTRSGHVVEGSLTIANGGIGVAHPYLSGVLPSYIGATDPSSNGWVSTVLNLATVSNLQAGGERQTPSDTIAPAAPSGVSVQIIQ